MRLSEAEARARLGGISRSTLWKWYGACRVATTASKRPALAWDSDKLDARQRELARAQKRLIREAS